MYVIMQSIVERLLEPLVLGQSELRLDLSDHEVQIDLDYGREDERTSERREIIGTLS